MRESFKILCLGAVIAFGLSACGKNSSPTAAPPEFQKQQASDQVVDPTPSPTRGDQARPSPGPQTGDDHDLDALISEAEASASPEGLRILQLGKSRVDARVIVIGSCWDYLDALFKKASISGKNLQTIFNSKKSGPYAEASQLQAGDWLYFVNHSYGDVEHSGVFVAWTNSDQKEALVLSYPGGNREVPGRFSYYDLSSVYNIMRGKPGAAVRLPALQLASPSPSPMPTPVMKEEAGNS